MPCPIEIMMYWLAKSEPTQRAAAGCIFNLGQKASVGFGFWDEEENTLLPLQPVNWSRLYIMNAFSRWGPSIFQNNIVMRAERRKLAARFRQRRRRKNSCAARKGNYFAVQCRRRLWLIVAKNVTNKTLRQPPIFVSTMKIGKCYMHFWLNSQVVENRWIFVGKQFFTRKCFMINLTTRLFLLYKHGNCYFVRK